ncbi:MAG: type I-D CRISPR-associated protein Cas10d/Csc3, partial [Caldilineae bacterium]
MLNQDTLRSMVEEYIETVVPAMLEEGYHLILVKGGPDYPHLPEQSHFAHIVNGVFGLIRLVDFLLTNRLHIPHLTEDTLRKALALFTVHEVHKAPDLERLGTSEFSIPLPRLRAEYERLRLARFAGQIDDHLLRAANVHKRSSKHGDLLLSNEPHAARLWLLVRIADTLASVKTPAEAVSSLRGYLADLSPLFAPQSPPGKYALYYHEIKDVRGVLTNVIHQAVAQQLAQAFGFFPLLYFATGTVYLGPANVPGADFANLTANIVDSVLNALGNTSGSDAARDGLRRQKFDFERYVYAFAGAESLLEVVRDVVLDAKPDARVAQKEIDGLVAKRKELDETWRAAVEQRLGIRLLDPKEHKTFNELWSLVRLYLLYVDTLLRDLSPETPRLDWFLHTFAVPKAVADNLRAEEEIWARGGVGKYVLIVAYHFLRGSDFTDRLAEALPPAEVIERLHRKVLAAFAVLDTQKGRQAAVAELGWREELENYLREHLYLSFAPAVHLADDGFESYTRLKRKGHTGSVCSICNRSSAYTQDLRTGILDDFGRVFSNRVLPALDAPSKNRLWCPICQLEFVFRKMLGMGLPTTAHYKNSHRIYLYVLPTFSFTPEHVRLFEPLLSPFHRVTSLPVRDYGNDHGLPRSWLERRTFDPEWLENLQDVLEREAEKIAGWGGRNFVGERISLGNVRGQPHYYLITWEKAAREAERDDARVATRTEAWAKALFVAAIISGLTSCKVYVTERPYLPVADPAELRATITLDAPPPALRGLLGGRTDEITLYGREQGRRSGLERVLDLSAALW